MTNDHYFRAYDNYVWQWEENGAVVAIPNGTTIAYRELINRMLNQLAPQGLPPFGSLLMAVAVTNPDGERAVRVMSELIVRCLPKLNEQGFLQKELDEALALLYRLSNVPAPYRQGQHRLLLLQTLFANAHNSLSVARSNAALRDLADKEAADNGLFRSAPSAMMGVYKDLKTLTIASRRFPTNAALLEAIAAVPDLSDDGPDLPEPLSPADFAQALLDNEKTAAIGALVKPLWAGLNMPLHHARPSQQPLGGVSDLTNKGPFDRLLLTEFAQDDLTFLSRLANNEALFLNRELPPAANDAERIFLIDGSLPTWGTPRTLAFAVLLALARHPKTDIRSRAFAVGKTVLPLAFHNVDVLINSLLLLDVSLHPVEGLTQFMEETGSRPTTELVLITSPDVLTQPALQRWLTDYQTDLAYLITTQANGAISIYKQQKKARKHLQTLTLPLEKLWQSISAHTSVPAAQPPPGVIRSTHPILFPYSGGTLQTASDGTVFCVTPERALLRWSGNSASRQKGWEMCLENLPTKTTFCTIGKMADSSYVLLLLTPGKRTVHLLRVETGAVQEISFADWRHSQHPNFLFADDTFFYVTPGVVWAIDVLTGQLDERKENLPPLVMKTLRGEEYSEINDHVKYLYARTILKNVTRLFINEKGNLVVNKHELRVNSGGAIKLSVSSGRERVGATMGSDKSIFSFSNGSYGRVDRNGMLLLHSVNDQLPVIYVPLVLDESLGIMTRMAFSGNTYYQSIASSLAVPACTPAEFWANFITPFVQTILNYGVEA